VSTLCVLKYLVKSGVIPACYREMRKVLESLAWMIFSDYLALKAMAVGMKSGYEILYFPYEFVSKEWYEWSIDKKLTIRHLGELKRNAIKPFIDVIKTCGKRRGYEWSNTLIEEAIFDNLSVSLYLFLVGREAKVPRELKEFIPLYDKNILIPLVKEDIRRIIKALKGKRLSKSEYELVEEVMDFIQRRVPRKLIPPYPSNEFVLGFVNKVFHSKLLEKYKEYSYFVHSYFASWHIFPFSSVLEFKVFKHELELFSKTLQSLIGSYIEKLLLKPVKL